MPILTNYILLFVLLISLGILYQKYAEKQSRMATFDDYGEIKRYLLKDKTLDKSKKPILWVHIPYEYNARDWLSFGSRSSHDLNQPYLYLTVKTIIQHCDESFKIVLIDDGSFEKLIPDWNIQMNLLGDPMKAYVRQLALTKLLYIYGGMNVPISFLCFRDLIGLFNRGTNDDTMFVCEKVDSNITSTHRQFYPSAEFMGAKKENETVKQMIEFMERTISTDYTSETKFLGEFDEWCSKKMVKGKVRLIPGTDVGTKTLDEEPVTVETLLGEDYIRFYEKMYGIWIPAKMILKRRHYEWFARLSPEQILESHFILAKYFLLTLAPDHVVETLENKNKKNKPDWISFWRVPINSNSRTMNVFGMMPQFLGNDVPRATNAGNLP